MNKTHAPMFKAIIFISYLLIGMNMCYFTRLHIYLDNKISAIGNQ